LLREVFRYGVAAAGVGFALPQWIPGAALGQDGTPPPSERITLGFIGIGVMGQGHLRCFLGFDETQVLAVCDVDRWRRENAQRTVEAAYSERRNQGQYRACEAYRDLRELLDRADIDAVVIATGDNWHATASVLAAQVGKDIYCEKPVALTIHEALAIWEAVRRYERVFQTGLQQRSAPEFHRACQLVQQGALGKITHVYVGFPGTNEEVNLPAEPVPPGLDWELWLGPAPWRPFNHRFHSVGPPPGVVPWHFCRDFGGGNLASNAVHAFDVVQWGLQKDQSGPRRIIPPETGEVPSLTYEYDGGVLLQVEWRLDPGKHHVPPGWDPKTSLQPFGALFVGTEGWVHVGRNGFLKVYPEEILRQSPMWPEHRIALGNHQQDWLEAIRKRSRPACDVEQGVRSTIVSLLGCIAHWTGRELHWDPAANRFLNNELATRLVRRAMREPWQI